MSVRAIFLTVFAMLLLSCSSLHKDVSTPYDAAVLTATPDKHGYLRVNERLVSPNGNYVLVMQDDGNLVINKNNCSGKDCNLWNTHTDQQTGEYYLAMQYDGNVVLYRGTPENNKGGFWQSQSDGAVRSYFLMLGNDANLAAYRGTGPSDQQGPIWSREAGLFNKKTVSLKIDKGPSNSCQDGVETIGLPIEYKYCWWQYVEESRSGYSGLEIAVPATLGNNDPYYLNGVRLYWRIDNDRHVNGIPVGARGSIKGVLNVAGALPGIERG